MQYFRPTPAMQEAAGSALPHFWRKGYQAPGLVEAAERLQELCAKEANRRAAVADAAVNAFNIAHSYAEHSAERKVGGCGGVIGRGGEGATLEPAACAHCLVAASGAGMVGRMHMLLPVLALHYSVAAPMLTSWSAPRPATCPQATRKSLAIWHKAAQPVSLADAADRLAELCSKPAVAEAMKKEAAVVAGTLQYAQVCVLGCMRQEGGWAA